MSVKIFVRRKCSKRFCSPKFRYFRLKKLFPIRQLPKHIGPGRTSRTERAGQNEQCIGKHCMWLFLGDFVRCRDRCRIPSWPFALINSSHFLTSLSIRIERVQIFAWKTWFTWPMFALPDRVRSRAGIQLLPGIYSRYWIPIWNLLPPLVSLWRSILLHSFVLRSNNSREFTHKHWTLASHLAGILRLNQPETFRAPKVVLMALQCFSLKSTQGIDGVWNQEFLTSVKFPNQLSDRGLPPTIQDLSTTTVQCLILRQNCFINCLV